MPCQPFEIEGGRRGFILPVYSKRAVSSACRPDPGLYRKVDNVGESLAAVQVAMLAQIVAEPDAGKLCRLTVCPFDGEQIRRESNALYRLAAGHGKWRPAAAARALRKYRYPAPSAASALTTDNDTKTPCHPNATETRATLSPATTAPR